MVKDFKYIIKRILIGVGIALCLMYLKGGLIANTYALEVSSVNPTSLGVQYSDSYSQVTNMSQFIWNGSIFFGYEQGTSKYLSHVSYRYDLSNSFKNTTFTLQGTAYNSKVNYTTNPVKIYVRDASRQISVCEVHQSSANAGTNSLYTPDGFIDYYCPNVYSSSNDIYVFVVLNQQVSNGDIFGMAQVLAIENNATEKAINNIDKNTKETNDLMKDSSTDDPSGDISGMNNKIATNGSISQLLTLPITLYQSILNATTGSCSPFNLGSLYNHNLTLPCINLSNLLGSTLYNIIDILLCGSFILVFRKKMVDIFNHMTSLNDRGNELE